MLTYAAAAGQLRRYRVASDHSVYLLYWYKSTNTDASAAHWYRAAGQLRRYRVASDHARRVSLWRAAVARCAGGFFTHFTTTTALLVQKYSAPPQRVSLEGSSRALRWWLLYSLYLLYWYKSTKTDAEGAAGGRVVSAATSVC
jgi:hypothetical protein